MLQILAMWRNLDAILHYDLPNVYTLCKLIYLLSMTTTENLYIWNAWYQVPAARQR